MRTRLMAAAMAAASGSAATAQTTVVRQRIDHGAEEHGRAQMVLRASRSSHDVVAAWEHNIVSSPTQVYYNVSTDGYQFRTDPGPAMLPAGWSEYGGNNPMAAFALDGSWWVGYMGLNPGLG